MVTLEKKVLEKVLMQELFESILEEMQTGPWRAYFQRKKLINLINKNWHEKTANSVQQTKTKMENKLTKKKNGSGVVGKMNPDRFKIINPVLSDTNSGLGAILFWV